MAGNFLHARRELHHKQEVEEEESKSSSSSSSTAFTTDDESWSSSSTISHQSSNVDPSPSPTPNKGPIRGSRSRKKVPQTPPRTTQGDCVVCQDRASGFHYNSLTCEGCKSFFRRSILKRAEYVCRWGQSCVHIMDMYWRRKCPACRLQKCLNVGMRPEFVVPKHQEPADPDTTTPEEPGPGSGTKGTSDNGLSAEDIKLIGLLILHQKELELPTEELALIWNEKTVHDIFQSDLKKDEEETCEMRFRHVIDMTVLTVRLIVEFSKQLKGFNSLLIDDKKQLLTANSSEVMMLRAARRYDYKTDTILFANGRRYTRENYNQAHIGDTADPLFDFCRHICQLNFDDAQFALLTAIVIFSDCPGLEEPEKVEAVQEIYLKALRTYVDQMHPSAPGVHFAKLLAVLPKLRTLGHINSQLCLTLKLNNKNLHPLLENIWIDPQYLNTKKGQNSTPTSSTASSNDE